MACVETNAKKRFALLYTGPEETADSSPDGVADAVTATALQKAHTDKEPSHYLIRATQGHSVKTIETEALLKPLTLSDAAALPETVVHGTYHSSWPVILASGGLKAMSRTHVHFATGPSLDSVLQPNPSDSGNGAEVTVKPAETVVSGMRTSAQVLIYIYLKKGLEAGVPFWISDNGVVLSEGVEKDGSKVVPLDIFKVVVERKKGLGILWESGKGEVQNLPEDLVKAGRQAGGRGGRGRGRGGRGRGGGERGGKSDGPKADLEKVKTEVVE